MRGARAFLIWVGLLCPALMMARPSSAAWPTEPSANVPLCTASGDQQSPAIVPDGAGGAIVSWTDLRFGNGHVYAQRILASGTPMWTADGIALCTAQYEQGSAALAPDGADGAIVAWNDYRGGPTYRIYAQRISAGGATQWAANGVALCTVASQHSSPALVTDGAGGAIVTWSDYRRGSAGVYAQRVSVGGAAQWTTDGVALAATTGDQESPGIVSDGVGGVIVAWQDTRSGHPTIYAQRISATGTTQWAANGVAPCTVTSSQLSPAVVSDGDGGAIVTWYDYRNSALGIYAQRISAGGTATWTASGVALCSIDVTVTHFYQGVASDGAGGAIVTWEDFRNFNADIHAQRVSSEGAVLWTADGVAVCTAPDDQIYPSAISDGAGGAIVTWDDYRSGSADIYAQRVSAGGAPRWTVDGVALCTAAYDQRAPAIAPDGAGGAIVAWQDARNGPLDIYAQRVGPAGLLGGTVDAPQAPAVALALDAVHPNPWRGGSLLVQFTLPTTAPARLELLDVAGRRVASHEIGSQGPGRHTVELGERQHLASGLYLVRLTQGANVRVARAVMLK